MTNSYVNGTVAVSTTVAAIVETGNQNDGVLVQNRGPEPVYIGGSSVTADTSSTGGVLVAPGEKVTVSTVGNDDAELYGITAAGTTYVSWVVVEN